MGFHLLEFGHHAETYSVIPNMILDWKMTPIFPVRFCCFISVMVISKFPLIRFSRFFFCFSNSFLNIFFISVFNRSSETVTSAILNVRISLKKLISLKLLIVVQMYEFQEKSEKLKKTRL